MEKSFSRELKEQLSRIPVKPVGCRRAELLAISAVCSQLDVDSDGRLFWQWQSESLPVIRRAEYLLRVLCGENPTTGCIHGKGGKNSVYLLYLERQETITGLLRALGLMTSRGALRDLSLPSAAHILEREDSRKAFLRGAFLAGGYISDPQNAYHFELLALSGDRAEELLELMNGLGLKAKLTERRGQPVVYLKDTEAISDALSLMGAYRSRLAWENARVLRSIQGTVNRQVNCETANLNKTAAAGAAQLAAIDLIEAKLGLAELSAPLREIALLRREYPEASLPELGEMLDPPVGKSGVNHRLRRLKAIAEGLEKQR